MSMKEDAKFVGAFVRGGSWEVGLRIARNVTPGEGQGTSVRSDRGRVSMVDFATEAGISKNTVAKYLAAWEWAADRELVDPSSDLRRDDEYDFSMFPQDEKVDGEWVDGCWMAFYQIACQNPPPWNPSASLEPRKSPTRHIAKDKVTPTPEQMVEHIKANPKVVTEVVKDPKVRRLPVTPSRSTTTRCWRSSPGRKSTPRPRTPTPPQSNWTSRLSCVGSSVT